MSAARPETAEQAHIACDPHRAFLDHRARVFRWACAMGCSHDQALDCVQEVFLRLVRAGGNAPDSGAVVSWLRRTASNVVVDHWRAATRRRTCEVSAANPALADGTFTPTSTDESARLGDTVSQLSEKQRLVLTCKVVDGMTFAAIARELGLAIPTVKTHYLRALGSLRETLEPQPREGVAR